MNTVVLGLGNIGSRLAKNLTAGGQKIIVAAKTLASAESLPGSLEQCRSHVGRRSYRKS
jgi:8-hydroxy-5-deazaflavin:NADPH oxidoreductase